jgi:hypothetical protein
VVTHTHANTYQWEQQGTTYRIILEKSGIVLQKQVSKNEEAVWYQYSKEQKNLFHLWYSIKPYEILAEDLKTGRGYYRITYSWDDEEEMLFQTTHQLTLQGQDSGLTLSASIEEESSPWHFLTRFEDSKFVYVWKNSQTNLAEQIDFLRYEDLGFHMAEIDGKQRAVWNQQPDYFLADKQSVPALKDMPHFLLLENSKGQQKVLLARQDLEKDLVVSKRSLTPSKRRFERNSDTVHMSTQRVLEYTINKKSSQLEPSTEEANFTPLICY